MSSKKQKNTIPGSIRPQGNNTFQIRFCLGKDLITQKYNRPQFTFHATPGLPEKEQFKEAEIERARLWVQLTGDAPPPILTDVTLAAYIQDKWLPDHVNENLKPSTQKWYESLTRIHVIPEIGQAKLSKITSIQLEGFFLRLKRRGVSDYNLKDLSICLNSAFQCAVNWAYIKENPMAGLKRYLKEVNKRVRVKVKKSRKIYDIDQAVLLLTSSRAAREGSGWPAKNPVRNLWNAYSHLIYLLALTNGLRRGEIGGLKWVDVDLSKKTIFIRQAIGEETEEEDIDSGEGGEVKTFDSIRQLLLADMTVEEFKVVQRLQEELREAAGKMFRDNDWVFANMVGDVIYPSTITHNFHKDRERLGLPKIKFHELRHTAATLLYEYFKIPLDIVGMMLGHSSYSFTRETYLHPSPEIFREGMGRVNEELARRFGVGGASEVARSGSGERNGERSGTAP